MLLTVGVLLTSMSFAQTTIFTDDFEGFSVGDLVSTSDDWSSWSGAASEEAVISDAYNHTDGGSNSMEIVANNDMIYYFGDLTSGVYQIKFWYYVETGQGAYFNVQHDFGANWAFSVEMADGGSGTLTYDNPAQTLNFTFPQDQWFEIILDIDIEQDEITVTLDEAVVGTWQFSLSESAGGPMIDLDCINFYGYPDINPPYYVDDFTVIEVAAGVEKPELELSATEFTSDGGSNPVLTLTNDGEEDLNFDVLVHYPQLEAKEYAQNPSNFTGTNSEKVVTIQAGSVPNSYDYNIVNNREEELTQLTSDIENSLGWGGDDNVDAEAAVLFKYDNNELSTANIKNYIGMELSSIVIFVSDLPVAGSTEARVYEGRDGLITGPMATPLTTEEFTISEAGGQATVSLSTPVYISGKDLFISYTLTQLPGEHCVAMDAGAPNDEANWTKTGVAWSEVEEETFGNFGIIGILTGEPMQQWLTLDMTQGTIAADGGTQDITLEFNTDGLESGSYNANVVLKTNDNDDDESYVEIPVTLDYVNSIDENNISIVTYPNPAKDYFHINASELVNNVTIYNIQGKEVRTFIPNTDKVNINISDLSAGTYIFEITTQSNTISKTIVIE